MKVTPAWVGTFETRTHTIIQDSWARVLKNLVWDRWMKVRPSTTAKELYFWIIEQARILDQGPTGADKRYSDLSAMYQAIENKFPGANLVLPRVTIEDNVMANGMPPLDYAANWSKQVGSNQAYWPQEQLFALMLAGEGSTYGNAYDGLPFFSKAHLINPADPNSKTYANLLAGSASSTPATDPLDALYPGACPIDTANASTLVTAQQNLAAAVGYIESLTGPNGKSRYLKVVDLVHGPFLKQRANEVVSAKFIGHDGSTENVLSRYGITPVTVPEITSATDYYLACETLADEGSSFIYQDREGFSLSSFTPMSQVELARIESFEWQLKGRNAAAYGLPYTFFKVKAT